MSANEIFIKKAKDETLYVCKKWKGETKSFRHQKLAAFSPEPRFHFKGQSLALLLAIFQHFCILEVGIVIEQNEEWKMLGNWKFLNEKFINYDTTLKLEKLKGDDNWMTHQLKCFMNQNAHGVNK